MSDLQGKDGDGGGADPKSRWRKVEELTYRVDVNAVAQELGGGR